MSISLQEFNTMSDEKNKEYRDLAIRFRDVCNDLDKKDKEIERLNKELIEEKEASQALANSNVILANIITELENWVDYCL